MMERGLGLRCDIASGQFGPEGWTLANSIATSATQLHVQELLDKVDRASSEAQLEISTSKTSEDDGNI